jgi:preprotein translocase subunit SecF
MSAIGRLLRGENQIDFPKWWRRAAVLSLVLVVVSIVALGVRGLNLGVEFTGGVSVEVPASGVSADEARGFLAEAGIGNPRVQIITDVAGNETIRVQTTAEDPQNQEQLRNLMAELADAPASEVSVTSVSASWGADVSRQALRALLFFLAAITVYLTLRLEFRMALGAIIATVHDIVITLGVYAVFQFEVSPGTVVAFLMVLGYSIYDTVVIYDKVKAGEPLVGMSNRMTYQQGVSRSMNLVLLRSLNTSITSLLPVLSLLVVGSLLLGAVTLNQFTIALAIGLIVGTYSSIMVAAPAVVLLKEREPRYKQLRERLGSGESSGSERRAGSGSAGPPATTATPGPSGKAGGVATSAGASSATQRPTPAGAIPPRPRKKTRGRKRS